MSRKQGRAVHGILLLDKPAGISSNQALQQAIRLFDARKGGHTGNLDGPATGLLPVCFGEATKVVPYLLGAGKRYLSTFRLGAKTDTADAAGTVIQRLPVPAFDRTAIEAVLASFAGALTQVPPMYSALKHAGEPLYRLARRGEIVERSARAVMIHAIRLLALTHDTLTVEVECSKGTYIRTLAEDIGAALKTCAHVQDLRRTAVGPLELAGAHTLPALQARRACQGTDALDSCLLAIDAGLGSLPEVELGEAAVRRLQHGQSVPMPPDHRHGILRIYGPGREFLGLGEGRADGSLAPRRLLQFGEDT